MYVLSAVYSDGVSQPIGKPHESLSQARMWAQQYLYENRYGLDAVEIWIQANTITGTFAVETVTRAAAHDWGL